MLHIDCGSFLFSDQHNTKHKKCTSSVKYAFASVLMFYVVFFTISFFSPGSGVEDLAVSDTYLLHVHGRTPLTTYATQVPLKAASLNTNDCFVLISKAQESKGSWVWMGKGSTGDEREMAKRIGQLSDKDPNITYEGK